MTDLSKQDHQRDPLFLYGYQLSPGQIQKIKAIFGGRVLRMSQSLMAAEQLAHNVAFHVGLELATDLRLAVGLLLLGDITKQGHF